MLVVIVETAREVSQAAAGNNTAIKRADHRRSAQPGRLAAQAAGRRRTTTMDADHDGELAPKRKKLEDGLARRVFAEDRFRELQQQNHGELHEYETQEARGICDDELKGLKASLQRALARKRDHLEALKACAAHRAAALDRDESRPGDPQFVVSPVDLGAKNDECRADLRQIVVDTVAPAVADEEGATLFKVGDQLSVFSKPRQKEFLGTLTSIDAARLTLALPAGGEVRFSLQDLQSRSLVASLAGPADVPARAN